MSNPDLDLIVDTSPSGIDVVVSSGESTVNLMPPPDDVIINVGGVDSFLKDAWVGTTPPPEELKEPGMIWIYTGEGDPLDSA